MYRINITKLAYLSVYYLRNSTKDSERSCFPIHFVSMHFQLSLVRGLLDMLCLFSYSIHLQNRDYVDMVFSSEFNVMGYHDFSA